MTNEDFIKGILCEVDTYDYKRWMCQYCVGTGTVTLPTGVIILDQVSSCGNGGGVSTEEDATQQTAISANQKERRLSFPVSFAGAGNDGRSVAGRHECLLVLLPAMSWAAVSWRASS